MKCKSLIAAFALVLPMSGCSLLSPDPPSNICEEENKPISKEELIYRALDHFYDDPHHQKPVNDRVKSRAYYKAPPALTHFANYKVRYLNISPTASRREVITSYYNKFPNCCLLYDPPVHFQTSSFEPRDVRGPR